MSGSESEAAPASPIWFRQRLQRKMRVRDACGETGPAAQSRAHATYESSVSVALLLSASESAAAPASPIWLFGRLQGGEEGQGCSWRDRATSTEQGRARATYESDVSVALLLSESESAAAPASPIWLCRRLKRGEEGQGCSWRDRAAGTEQGARDLLERRQSRIALERLRERRGARVSDMVVPQAAARRGGSGMLVARQGRQHRAGRARRTGAMPASRCS